MPILRSQLPSEGLLPASDRKTFFCAELSAANIDGLAIRPPAVPETRLVQSLHLKGPTMTNRAISKQTLIDWLGDKAELAVLDIRPAADVGYASPLFATNLPCWSAPWETSTLVCWAAGLPLLKRSPVQKV